MFSTLLDRMGASPRAPARIDATRASSSDSIHSVITVDTSNAQSSSSTPPTSIGDSISVSSGSMKLENALSTPTTSIADGVRLSSDSTALEGTLSTPVAESSRSRRARTSVGTYNVKVLSGTAIHAPKKFSKNNEETDNETRRRTVSGDTLVGGLALDSSSTKTAQRDLERLAGDKIEALDFLLGAKRLPKSKGQGRLGGSPKARLNQEDLSRRKPTRSTGEIVENLAKTFSVLGKRGRENFDSGFKKVKRELRNLADTNEFAKIDTQPVLLEVWSNGKFVPREPPKKKKKVEEVTIKTPKPQDARPVEKKKAGRREKVWLNKGLYSGQESKDFDWFSGYTEMEKESIQDIALYKPNGFMPLPMWHGQWMLHLGRNFQLPFDVCSPLPPGQPKPDEWRKTSSNRFVGEAAAMWKKSSLFDSFSSKCVCSPQLGCDEDCQNRIMLYECDDTNCAAGRDHCTNRAFADLQERRKGGGKYRIGVEVIKTADRGYGVRSNRSFEAHQIIVEYTGEIITEEECDRRMNEDYKDNDCYYLMSFDQNMIIDATKGSIARFVNHSCNPNCRMVKWIVGGKPRMALFAGDKPIMTGDELTYDYNFDPFSAKNVQECRCGSDNCRGVLGPRAKDQKAVKTTIKEAVKAGVRAGKRKLKELFGGDEGRDDHNPQSPKKRKIKEAKGVKRSASSATMKLAKGSAKAIKKVVSAKLLSGRKAVTSKRGGVFKKTVKVTPRKTYGKGQTKLSSRNSSLTLVAADSTPRKSKVKNSARPRKSIAKNVVRSIHGGRPGLATRASSSEETIRVISIAGEE